ncbi:MAG: DoxX family protein [Acidobacteria bacterium]|nr:DoxX family protein [Acidobacteriota bacterium]
MMSSQTRYDLARLVLRILVGWVFLSEGIQKFLFPAALGVGRFAKIGIPYPQYTAPFVGGVEIICGLLLIVGAFVSVACVGLLAVILTAIITTKVPMLAKQGVWATLHEARTDVSMLLGLIAILLLGAGGYALRPQRRG